MSIVKIDKVGQIYLPSELRKKLGFKKGDHLNLEVNIEDRIIVLRPESKPDHDKSINSLRVLMAEIHNQTKDIPSEVIEQEIEEAIKEVRSKKRHVKSSI
jgi:AbrB family looped-hinge helix DNA binding protein